MRCLDDTYTRQPHQETEESVRRAVPIRSSSPPSASPKVHRVTGQSDTRVTTTVFFVGLASYTMLAVTAFMPIFAVVSPLGDPPPAAVSRQVCTAWVGCAASDTFPDSPSTAGIVALCGAVTLAVLLLITRRTRHRWTPLYGALTNLQVVTSIVTVTWVVVAIALEFVVARGSVTYDEWNYAVVVRPRWTLVLVAISIAGVASVKLREMVDRDRRVP